jgi:hypothetical protein
VIKAVMARESQFDPSPDHDSSVLNAGAGGLMQITPMGMDALWRLDFRTSNNTYSAEIQQAKSNMNLSLPTINGNDILINASDRYLNSGSPNYQIWYRNILAEQEAYGVDNNAFLNTQYKPALTELGTHILDGKTTNGDTLTPNDEIKKNVIYGARILSISQNEIIQATKANGYDWKKLSDADKTRFLVVNYQSSVGGGEGSCMAQAIENISNQGGTLDWENVKGNIPDTKNRSCGAAIQYAEDILNYAKQGGQ